MKLSELLQRFGDLPIMELVLFSGILFALGLLAYIQCKKDKLDLRYLILDDDKKPSIYKLGQFLALMVSTWLVIYQAEHDRLTDATLSLYMGTWAAPTLLKAWIDRKNPPPTKDQSQN